MVISKLNLNKIQENIHLIGEFLEKLRKISKMPKKEFLSDERNPAASESFLRRCIEAIFDIGRHILTKSFAVKSLEYKEVAKELGNIARAKGMSQMARDTGLSRESLYKALSGERNPTFDTILEVIDALGLKLHAGM